MNCYGKLVKQAHFAIAVAIASLFWIIGAQTPASEKSAEAPALPSAAIATANSGNAACAIDSLVPCFQVRMGLESSDISPKDPFARLFARNASIMLFGLVFLLAAATIALRQKKKPA
jgi:hypothetical protein